ncbi:hypothetical protein GD1_93 [Paraglaciecola Antarctic GD virus 1]|nr:hypothetical protein GD1_93 [Paraglaciecola Antarctic GD virus 1]
MRKVKKIPKPKVIYAIRWDEYEVGYGATQSHTSLHLTEQYRELYFEKIMLSGDKVSSNDPTGFYEIPEKDIPAKVLSKLYYTKTVEVDYDF